MFLGEVGLNGSFFAGNYFQWQNVFIIYSLFASAFIEILNVGSLFKNPEYDYVFSTSKSFIRLNVSWKIEIM